MVYPYGVPDFTNSFRFAKGKFEFGCRISFEIRDYFPAQQPSNGRCPAAFGSAAIA
jgi:hypothetical protein